MHENITKNRNPLLFEIARENILNSIRSDPEMRLEVNGILKSLSKNHVLSEIIKDI